jgi:hypothetical protein
MCFQEVWNIVRWRAFSDPSISLTSDPPLPNDPDGYVFSAR